MKNQRFDPTSTDFDADGFGRQLGRQLADAPLTLRQTERLKAARLKAVAVHAHAHAPVGVLAGVGAWFERHHVHAWHMRRAAAFSVLLAVAVGVWWQNQPSTVPSNLAVAEDEVDAMLLSDDLPPDAYLSDQVDHLTQQGS